MKSLVDKCLYQIIDYQVLILLFCFLSPISQADFGPIIITPDIDSNQQNQGSQSNQKNHFDSSSSFRSTLIIDEKTIANSGASSVADLLQSMIGLNVIDSQSGSPSSVFLRGFDAHHVLIKLDGFEINDPTTPNNRAVLEYLNISQIKQIKITQGTALASEKSALAGVIEISTFTGLHHSLKNNNNKKQLNINYQTGSYDNQKISFDLALTRTDRGIYLSAGESKQTMPSAKLDNQEKEQSSIDFQQLSIYRELSRNNTLNLSFYNNQSNLGYDDCYSVSFAPSNDCNSGYEKQSTSVQLLTEGQNFDNRLAFNYQSLRRTLSTNQENTGQYKANGKNFHWDYQRRFNRLIQLKIGFKHKKDQVNEIYAPINQQSIDSDHLYSEINFKTNDHLFNFGVNAQRYSRKGRRKTYQNSHFGYQYQINSNLVLNASFSNSTKEPSIYQLFDSFAGNQNLVSESAEYYEFGLLSQHPNLDILNNQLKNTQLDLRIYQASIKNYLGYNLTTSQYQNDDDKVGLKGVNLIFQSIVNDWHLSGSFLHTRAYHLNSNQRQLARRPINQLQIQLSKKINRYDFGWTQRWQSKIYDRDGSDKTLPGFGVSDLLVSYRFNQSAPQLSNNSKILFRINNLFDRNYRLADGYRYYRRNYLLSFDISF